MSSIVWPCLVICLAKIVALKMHSNMFARQSKPCRNRVKNFEAKVLLQIFKVSLAPKIHFTWFMCQAPTKYSKSPLL